MQSDRMQLPQKNWLTSQELIALYGVEASYSNAAKAARRLMQDHDIPWELVGKKWRTSDPNLMAMLQKNIAGGQE